MATKPKSSTAAAAMKPALKSVTVSVKGAFAFGYLQSEEGVHRLVRLSPFDSAHRRHTSFAKVELWPDIQSDIEIEVADRDIRIDTFRASGAGGQHVQKNDTAVRITHLPTGVVVQCQNQRSQAQNRDRAMQILKARLFEMERARQEAEMAELKGENVDAGWGNQIRSYVLASLTRWSKTIAPVSKSAIRLRCAGRQFESVH